MKNLLIGLTFSSLIALAGYKKESLSLSGLFSAIILGTSLYYLGGLFFSSILVAFFISSSLLTKYRKSIKNRLEDVNEKGGRRDYIQVMANGLLGLIYACFFYLTGNHVFILAYGVAFAASNADTWASEIGVLSKRQPLSIISFKEIERGMSGGVSPLGTVAAVLGAGFIGVILTAGYTFIYGIDTGWLKLFIICSFCGFTGSMVDSIIGATLQGKYCCSICNRVTEKKIHHGSETIKISGVSFINNDAVNFSSGFVASIIAIVLYLSV